MTTQSTYRFGCKQFKNKHILHEANKRSLGSRPYCLTADSLVISNCC